MNISIFGLGIIGKTWADNLVQDGLSVKGWNRTPKALSYYTSDARAAAETAEVLFIVVSDPPAVQSVLNAILPVLRPGQTVIQSSTIDAASSREFARRVEATGAAFLEAPFTGSKPAAEQRKTVFYTGGALETLERVRPVLARLSRVIQHTGEVGSASAIKLAMNLNLALMGEALGEALGFARASGIPDDAFFAALRLNAGWSGLAELKEPRLRSGDFSPQFSLQHMGKDLRLARGSAPDLALPQLDALLALYQRGFDHGWKEEDFLSLSRFSSQNSTNISLRPNRGSGSIPE